MNDMRFGREEARPQSEFRRENMPTGPKQKWRVTLLAVGVALLLVAGAGYFFMQRSVDNGEVAKKVEGDTAVNKKVGSEYFAVFLDNEQVYFGKMISKSREEMVLRGVYYLQANTAANANQKFSLVKLGQELHGPTDEMTLNMEHVIFYEQLREDSEVVGSIREQN